MDSLTGSRDRPERRSAMKRTGIVRDERYNEHITDDYHPENPHRLRSIYTMLQQKDMEGHYMEISARPATREELEMVHLPSYIDLIASTAGQPARRLDPDTVASPKSYEVACLAAGGVLEAIETVLLERRITPSPLSGLRAITPRETALWGSVSLITSL